MSQVILKNVFYEKRSYKKALLLSIKSLRKPISCWFILNKNNEYIL